MARERHDRVSELFLAACELDGAERAAFLERACDDDAMRAEVLELLAHDARPHPGLSEDGEKRNVLIRGALLAADAGRDEAGPERIGPYELLEKIGEGGMGEIWAADQLEPVRRRVALKLIKRGMDSAQIVARFEAERQALARMSHPHVAQVFDGGTTDQGRPYFVMEYVAGEPITEHCDRRRLPTRARLELFLGVCEGVQHAHQKGLVHRDLKPANLLVTEHDGKASPKIIDFGVARAVSGQLSERTLHTLAGQVVGTLDYMSPEQADPTGADVDTRSDIYSLGVVLYELVSGLLPFDFGTRTGQPLSEARRAIRELDPPTPSTRLRKQSATAMSNASRRGTDGRSLVRQLHGDLDWICLKALEKDPDRRYASASELADDLRRHLADEPVLAGRPGTLYRARKYVRRHRVAVAAGVVAVAALVVGAVGIVTGRLEAEARAEQARRERDAWRVAPLMAEVDALWPAVPARIPALEDWLARARPLVDELTDYRAALTERRDDFPTDLLDSLGRMERDLLSPDAVSRAYGWSVPARLALARDLEAGFAPGGRYAEAWADALPAIRGADPAFADLAPQVGLAPLGPDPRSGLPEFAHLLSGEPAVRDPATGELVLTPETGLVLVLLPGGTFLMGSQGTDAEGPNYVPGDPDSVAWRELIEPLRDVRLEPFFLSKYELTQAQWERCAGWNPSAGEGGIDPRHPVNRVQLVECIEVCVRLGLAMPSEEQWEYGARGGTTTRWWVGDDWEALKGAENLGDPPSWDPTGNPGRLADGVVGLAPVGSFAPNPFGLHDVLGNVSEWTGSPVEDDVDSESRDAQFLARGGSYVTPGPPGARASFRLLRGPPEFQRPEMGFRPMRPVERVAP